MSQNGNGNSFEEEVQLVQTTDEEGNIHLFEKLDELEVEGKDYALLIYRGQQEAGSNLPVSLEVSSDEDDEVIVMRLSHDEDGAEIYENIDDEKEFDKVAAYIESLQEEEDDDEDDEDGEAFDAVKLGELLQQLDDGDEETKKN
ncbi:MAG: DUF1292 domain-containing protein [Vampirovibrionales bacterium]|nr:DUF1292 domain-containing protein [Vampirovibrionales bacterium]